MRAGSSATPGRDDLRGLLFKTFHAPVSHCHGPVLASCSSQLGACTLARLSRLSDTGAAASLFEGVEVRAEWVITQ